MYETLNKGTILEPRSLWMKKQPIYDIGYFKWELEQEKKYGHGVHKNIMVT
jgi:hypothetical protein